MPSIGGRSARVAIAVPSATPSGNSCATRVEEASRDRVLDERHRRQVAPEHLHRERELEHAAAGAADTFGNGESRRARRDELLPEIGCEPERLVLANDLPTC